MLRHNNISPVIGRVPPVIGRVPLVIGRVPPVIGLYDIIKFVNPRLLHIQFLEDVYFGSTVQTTKQPDYLEAHDRSGDLIYTSRINKNGLESAVTISLIWDANGKHKYYLTSIHVNSSKNVLDYSYEYIGETLEDAIFKFIDV